MKLLSIFTVCLLFMCNLAVAQSNPEDINDYPMAVTLKVRDVVSAVALSPGTQLLLAKFFNKEENAISSAQQSGQTPKQVAAVKSQLRQEFEGILSPGELAEYSSKRKGSEYARRVTTGSSQ